jgi:hypothetical protein
MVDNCPWCWAELGPDDVMCPSCRQQARRAPAPPAASIPAPAPEPAPATEPTPASEAWPSLEPAAQNKKHPRSTARPPLPPAKRGELIVTNPELAPLWQRFLVVVYKVGRFFASHVRGLPYGPMDDWP